MKTEALFWDNLKIIYCYPEVLKCILDKWREDKVNLNSNENDQQWYEGWDGVCVEVWWASKGGSSDKRNAREGDRGVRRKKGKDIGGRNQ